MNKHITFCTRGSLVAIGLWMRRVGIWAIVEELVHIEQKAIQHKPLEKLLDAFINILAGGCGVVEVNTLVRPERALQRAFRREGCADQSQVSRTLDRCTANNVQQMRQANQEIYRAFGQSYHHNYGKQWQVLDVDMSGMPAGKQGEGVTKGFFSGQRGRRGRQLGRVLATQYSEIVVDLLYSGKTQLERSFQELVEEAEETMGLTPAKRERTVLRVDGGGGADKDINWVLERGYGIMVKVKNWQRANKLARSVMQWHPDPKVPDRQFGWVEEPHAYLHPTRQLAVRRLDKQGKWKVRVLVTNLDERTLFGLASQPFRKKPSGIDVMQAMLYAYDLRGGAVEASLKDSKQGLGITKRNKRNFHAQEMLILLAQLASNLIAWIRYEMARHVPSWRRFGSLRIVRDLFHIPAKIELDAQGRILQITLNEDHVYAAKFLAAIAPALSNNDLTLNLHKI